MGKAGRPAVYFFCPSTSLTTWSRVKTLLATVPGAVFASTLSTDADVTVSVGSDMSCGNLLPASNCCATQKAKVDEPGSAAIDIV